MEDRDTGGLEGLKSKNIPKLSGTKSLYHLQHLGMPSIKNASNFLVVFFVVLVVFRKFLVLFSSLCKSLVVFF